MDMATIRNAHGVGACGVRRGLAPAALHTPKKNLIGGFLLDALGGLLCSVAGDLLSKFHDDAVVDDAVDGGGGGHGVFEDWFPL